MSSSLHPIAQVSCTLISPQTNYGPSALPSQLARMPHYLGCTLTMINCHTFQAPIGMTIEGIPAIASERINKHFSIQHN